jgi:putative nucleotidyltransferase with HDIG domain
VKVASPPTSIAPAREPERQRDLGSPVGLLITLAAVAASILLVLTAATAVDSLRHDPGRMAVFLVLTLTLQLFSFEVYGRGSIGVSAVGLLATAFTLGVGPTVAIAFVAALAQWGRKRGLLHRAIFDAANFALSAGGAAGIYATLNPHSSAVRLAVGTLAGLVYGAINHGLLCLAMSLSESLPIREVWAERFHWARYHVLAFGPLAVAMSIAYEKMGVVGVLAFTLPPAVLVFSVRQYLDRTRQAVEEVRAANEELRVANSQLAAKNEDLNQLFRFAGGLTERAHDRHSLLSYAEESLARLTGAHASVTVGPGRGGIALVTGGARVGGLELSGDGFDTERWGRLRDAILPQLATAIESVELVERVRQTHLATIAALSKSMEAKDAYTGGHIDRVADVALALAETLGFAGADLDAVYVGALLHDIGKIGISDQIINKPGPLDDDEWRVMREHPVISDMILADIDLHPFVRQIARSSHERIDGTGYPDGLLGESIPLPARVVLVADAWDALTTDRSYRRARPLHAALEEIRAHTGTQFCPRVVAALEALYRDDPHVLGGGRLAAVQADVA